MISIEKVEDSTNFGIYYQPSTGLKRLVSYEFFPDYNDAVDHLKELMQEERFGYKSEARRFLEEPQPVYRTDEERIQDELSALPMDDQ